LSESIHSRELIGIAIGVEQRGIAFYDVMARSSDDPGAGRVFGNLAEMERQHLQLFGDMLAGVGELENSNASPENREYLDALLASSVFTDDLAASEMATKVSSDLEAVELAIVAEKDSILLYCQLRETMAETDRDVFDRITAEEKKHLGQLITVKKEMVKRQGMV